MTDVSFVAERAVLDGVTSLTFDLMGTCVDWHTGITNCLSTTIPTLTDPSAFATEWRQAFFDFILASFARGEPSPEIDIVHKITLDRLLQQHAVTCDEHSQTQLVSQWHHQTSWLDSKEGIEKLRTKFDVVVLANGSTRLQLDILGSSGLPFHSAFSSQLLGHTKPDPEMYETCLKLLDREPESVAMVAAHAYDLRAAKKVGMKTVYIWRDTEDPDEDMDKVREEADVFIDGRRSAGAQGGLAKLAAILQC